MKSYEEKIREERDAAIDALELENADLRRERNEFEQRLQELRKAHERLTEHCHDMAAQFETDQGIIKADGKEIHYLRQRVRELESALEAADEGRNYANQLLTEQSQRVRELEAALEARKSTNAGWNAYYALRKRIDDAPVVAWQSPLRYGSQLTFPKPNAPSEWDDFYDEWFCKPLISREDLQK